MFNYSTSQLIVLPISFGLMIISAFLIKRFCKPKTYKIAFIVISSIVLGLEIFKQIYYLATKTYTVYRLPIHFCSLFVLLYPLSHFFGEKLHRVFKPMAFAYSLIAVILLLVHPTSMTGNSTENVFESYETFHGFFFHMAVVMYFIYSLILNDYTPRTKDAINNCLGVLFYVSYAIPIAFKLNCNYVNILYSYFQPLEKFRLTCGQVAYDIVLVIIGLIAVSTIPLIGSLFKYIKAKRRKKYAT